MVGMKDWGLNIKKFFNVKLTFGGEIATPNVHLAPGCSFG